MDIELLLARTLYISSQHILIYIHHLAKNFSFHDYTYPYEILNGAYTVALMQIRHPLPRSLIAEYTNEEYSYVSHYNILTHMLQMDQ